MKISVKMLLAVNARTVVAFHHFIGSRMFAG